MHHLTQMTQYTNFKPFMTSTWQPTVALYISAQVVDAGTKFILPSLAEIEEESGGDPAKKEIYK